MMLSAQQMRSLPDFFLDIPDPRRAQGRRHSLPTVLAIACGAILCGMRGYKAIADWAQSLGPKAREIFRCRRVNGRLLVPSESIIRDVMIRVDPTELDLGDDLGDVGPKRPLFERSSDTAGTVTGEGDPRTERNAGELTDECGREVWTPALGAWLLFMRVQMNRCRDP